MGAFGTMVLALFGEGGRLRDLAADFALCLPGPLGGD
jgi:hypothetical protein